MLKVHSSSPGHALSLLSLAATRLGRAGRLYFRPEFVVTEYLAFPNLLTGFFQNGLQPRRIGHEQPFDLVRILDANDHGHRPAVARDHHRPVLTGLQKGAELRFDFRNGCDFHNSTSSPPTIRRLPSFSPMARICT